MIRHGVEGLLAEPRNSEDFASQIDMMTSDRVKWLSFSDNALRRHREQFSDSEMASRVANAYDRTLDTKRAAPK